VVLTSDIRLSNVVWILLIRDLQHTRSSQFRGTCSSKASSEILERLLISNFRCIDERSLVYFADNERYVIDAYAECGEGLDRAGGFAIQVCHPTLFFVLLLIQYE